MIWKYYVLFFIQIIQIALRTGQFLPVKGKQRCKIGSCRQLAAVPEIKDLHLHVICDDLNRYPLLGQRGKVIIHFRSADDVGSINGNFTAFLHHLVQGVPHPGLFIFCLNGIFRHWLMYRRMACTGS